MRKFLNKILIFTIIPLFIIFSLEYVVFLVKNNIFTEEKLLAIYENEHSQYGWINNLQNDNIVILSGSSSVKYGLSCNKLDSLTNNKYKFVNIAKDARDPIASFAILKNLNLNNVKSLYFGLDPWIYSKKYYKHRNNYMYLDFSFQEVLLYSKEDSFAFVKRYNNLIKSFFLNIFNSEKSINYNIPSDYGSVGLNRKPKNFETLNLKDSFQLNNFGWSELQFIYLKKIMSLCKSKNIKFIVFIPPKRSDYSLAYEKECHEIHQQFIKKLMDYKINVNIFGHFDEFNSKYDSIYFADAYHLNDVGQKKYSELFKKISLSDSTFISPNYKWFKVEN